MVTPGAAPLIVCTLRRVRRSTSTDAFQTCDAGRAGVPLPSEAVQRTRPIGRADADQAGARPYHLQWRITFLIACEPGSGGSNFSNSPYHRRRRLHSAKISRARWLFGFSG